MNKVRCGLYNLHRQVLIIVIMCLAVCQLIFPLYICVAQLLYGPPKVLTLCVICVDVVYGLVFTICHD